MSFFPGRRKSPRRKKSPRNLRRRKSRRRSRRRFGYSHNQGPRIYNAHMQDGILLADNAFNWAGNPEARAENAGSG